MHRRNPSDPIRCPCSRETTQPRRGLCQRCYMAKYRGIEKEAQCRACGCADPAVLVRRRIGAEFGTLCGNCSVRLGRNIRVAA